MITFTNNNNLLRGSAQKTKYDPNKLVLVFDTSKEPANNTVSIPVNGASPNLTVEWGDGLSDVYTTTGFKTHTYASPGIYTVQISGVLRTFSYGIGASSTNNKLKLTKCLSFGNVQLTSLLDAFRNCTNLIQAPTYLPTSSTVVNLSGAFANCSNFNYPISAWNVSSVLNFNNAFLGASIFNQPLNNWNVGSATIMTGMFSNAVAFNQPLSSWNTSSVGPMTSMFQGASSFNQNINSWNVSNVYSLSSMFAGADAFNQPLNNWNTSSCTAMGNMFNGAINFNQNIGGWNVSLVTTMASMFNNADSFSCNLGSWNLSGLNAATSLNSFMINATGMTTADYNATLIGWNNNKATWRNDLAPNFGGSKYSSAASAARAALVSYGWTITDGGLAP